jgi:HlyD family secretion protein
VFLVDGGRVRQTEVKLVARNATAAWVSQGLSPEAQVVVYPPPTLTDGARVRARR